MKVSLARRIFGPKRPPGPSFSELQNQPLYKDDFCGLEYPLQLSKKYGDIFYISANKQYVITGPEGFQHVLKTNARNYTKDNFFYQRMKRLFGESILVTDGEHWKQRRKVSNPAFNNSAVLSYAPIITKATEHLANRWRNETPSTINMMSEMSQHILGFTFQLFTGQTCPEDQIRKLEKNHFICKLVCFSYKPFLTMETQY